MSSECHEHIHCLWLISILWPQGLKWGYGDIPWNYKYDILYKFGNNKVKCYIIGECLFLWLKSKRWIIINNTPHKFMPRKEFILTQSRTVALHFTDYWVLLNRFISTIVMSYTFAYIHDIWWFWIVHCWELGIKWKWPVLKCYPRICWEWLRKSEVQINDTQFQNYMS